MNPLAKLNRLFTGAVTWHFDSAGPSHDPKFTAIASIHGRNYSGTGASYILIFSLLALLGLFQAFIIGISGSLRQLCCEAATW